MPPRSTEIQSEEVNEAAAFFKMFLHPIRDHIRYPIQGLFWDSANTDLEKFRNLGEEDGNAVSIASAIGIQTIKFRIRTPVRRDRGYGFPLKICDQYHF